MWLLCQQTTGFRHSSPGLRSAEDWGKIYGACCADTLPAAPPPEQSGAGRGRAPGAAAPSGIPGRLEGWESSPREARLLAGAGRGGWELPCFSSGRAEILVRFLGRLCACKRLLRFLGSRQSGKAGICSHELPFVLFPRSLAELRVLTRIPVLRERPCPGDGSGDTQTGAGALPGAPPAGEPRCSRGALRLRVPRNCGPRETLKCNPRSSDAIPCLGLSGGRERLRFLSVHESGHSCSCLISQY